MGVKTKIYLPSIAPATSGVLLQFFVLKISRAIDVSILEVFKKNLKVFKKFLKISIKISLRGSFFKKSQT